jgi:hypothetical protein
MKVQIFAAAFLLAGAIGCSSAPKNLGTAAQPRYSYSVGGSSVIVTPSPTPDADLTQPELSSHGGTMTIEGKVRIHAAQLNPYAALRIVIANAAGHTIHDMRAVLTPTETAQVYHYRANLSPVPPDGSSIVVTYSE